MDVILWSLTMTRSAPAIATGRELRKLEFETEKTDTNEWIWWCRIV